MSLSHRGGSLPSMIGSTPPLPDVPSVAPHEVADLVDSGAALVDVRERPEWDVARIAGAELRPMSAIGQWWTELPRDRTVVVYCRTGQRSAHAVHALITQAGFDNVVNLTGGIVAWAESGRPVEAG